MLDALRVHRQRGGAEETLWTLKMQALSAPKPRRISHCLAWRFLADSQTFAEAYADARHGDAIDARVLSKSHQAARSRPCPL